MKETLRHFKERTAPMKNQTNIEAKLKRDMLLAELQMCFNHGLTDTDSIKRVKEIRKDVNDVILVALIRDLLKQVA